VGYKDTPAWKCAVEMTKRQLVHRLSQCRMATESEVRESLKRKSSPGIPFIYQGFKTKGELLDSIPDGQLFEWAKKQMEISLTPVLWNASMKKEPVPIEKLLRRKQRMFMVMPLHAVVLHKFYFGAQSKKLRSWGPIKHGDSWFFGGVNVLAKEFLSTYVRSDDAEFWDKRFPFMEEIYNIRKEIFDNNNSLTDDQLALRDKIVSAIRNVLLVLPSGDVIMIRERTNPSGCDSTTENNNIARILLENYMRILFYYESHGTFPQSLSMVKGVYFCGDDRIACSKHLSKEYLDFFANNIHKTGVINKVSVETQGPVGAEFMGFTIARSHWDRNYFVPLYKLDKLNFGFFATHDETQDVTASRLMAFALLLYPRFSEFKRLQPVVVSYIHEYLVHTSLQNVTLDFWTDETFLRRMWTGEESVLRLEEGYFVGNDSRINTRTS
jgi:hypothetical protein